MVLYCILTGLSPYKDCANEYVIGTMVTEGKRPVIPSSVSKSWQDLITACWDQVPEVRPSFDNIVEFLATSSFTSCGVDASRFASYQDKVRLPSVSHFDKGGRIVASCEDSPCCLKARADGGDSRAQYEYGAWPWCFAEL